MKILKGIFRQGLVDDEWTRVGSKKSARLHEAVSEKSGNAVPGLRSPSNYSGGVGGSFFQQTLKYMNVVLFTRRTDS